MWDGSRHSYFPDAEIPVGYPIPAAVSIGPDGDAYVSFTRLINVERIQNPTSGSPGPAQEIGPGHGHAVCCDSARRA